MTFEELTAALGVEDHLPLPEGYFPVPEERKSELCSLEMIDSLQEDFGVFAEYYDAVREGFSDLENDPMRKAYLDSVSLYFKDATMKECRKIKYPPSVNTPASNMLPLLVHVPSIRRTYEIYRERGLSHEDAVASLSIFNIYIREEEHYRTKIVGISRPISAWMAQFTKGMMFYPGHAGLNFQPIKLSAAAPHILMHRESRECIPVFGNDFPVHKSGIPLGSAGAEDEEGSFLAKFEETADAYLGYPSDSRRISTEKQSFSKKEWELVLAPGDDVISTHIFWEADFTPETVEWVLKDGVKKAVACYPEFDFKALYCCSWLMSPDVNDALGEASKLSQFSSRFTRYPVKSAGKAVLGYVFPDDRGLPVEQLSEKTGLQRAFKKKLLAGEHIFETPGAIPFATGKFE